MEATLDLVAHAKINLTLDVLGKREDGYHEVEMIMQSIDLHDRLSFTKVEQGIEIVVDHPQIPIGEENLIYQAAKLLFDEFNLVNGLEVKLDKKIPIAAGLAGGSSDAAATLVAINKLWDLGLSEDELAKRGAKLGADIPFCIQGGTQLATGIGTELEKLPSAPELYLVVVNPPLEVSTPEVYQSLNLNMVKEHPQTAKVITGLKKKKSNIIVNNLVNVLETATLNLYPEVEDLKIKIGEVTTKALMSGSGPTILGFVEDIHEAKKLRTELVSELPSDYRVIIARTINEGIEEI